MTAQPNDPTIIRSKISAYAREVARQQGSSTSEVQKQFAIDVLLSRLDSQQPGTWRLHGSVSLAARQITGARPPKDVDIEHLGGGSPENARDAFTAAVERTVASPLRFEVAKSSRDKVNAHGMKATVVAFLGNVPWVQIPVDLRAGSGLDHQVRETVGPMHGVSFHGIETGRYSAVPLVTQIAEKMSGALIPSAMTNDGVASTRYKDVVDLLAITRSRSFDGEKVRSEFERCAIELRQPFPDRYRPPSTDSAYNADERQRWISGVQKALDNSAFAGMSTADAEQELAECLAPVLAGGTVGHWNPSTRTYGGAEIVADIPAMRNEPSLERGVGHGRA